MTPLFHVHSNYILHFSKEVKITTRLLPIVRNLHGGERLRESYKITPTVHGGMHGSAADMKIWVVVWIARAIQAPF